MWLYTGIAVRALKVSYSDVGEGGVAEKNTIFPEHPVISLEGAGTVISHAAIGALVDVLVTYLADWLTCCQDLFVYIFVDRRSIL